MGKRSSRTVSFAVTILSILCGCVSHVHYPLETRFVPVSRPAPPEVFDHRHLPANVSLEQAGKRRHGYLARTLSMKASFDNGQPGNLLTGVYYDSGGKGKKPLVIVLPVWGVSEYPSTRMAHAILKRSAGSMNVLRIDGKRRLMAWKEIERSTTHERFTAALSESAERLRHSVIDTRRLIDWARSRDEIAGGRIALVGFSVSAITGTLVTQSDPRIKASALVMGGADIASIVSECPGNEKETRDGVMQSLGLDIRSYERSVAAAFEGVDPTDYPNRVNPETVLIVDAAKDDCIPRRAREAWWHSLGRPERISMNYDHRGSFLGMTPLGFNFLRARIYEHLARKL